MSTGTAVAATDARPVLATGGRIQPVIPQTMEDAYRLGKAICAAGMAPRGMETPEKCMVAILRGLEVGLSPMQAVDKIAVVNGRPTIWGDGAMALVRASGLCEFVKERIEGEADGRVAICETKRRGETEAVVRRFSVAQAKEAGLWNKQGPWKQFPERMLQMRARAFALRDLYADVLGGLYLREEIEDDRRQDGPGAPPPPPAEPARPAIASAPPANGNAGPAAPPAEKVEDAELVEAPSPEPERVAAGMNLPQEETELLVEAGALPSGSDQHPPLAQEEALDPDLWLAEVKDRFDEARTSADVDGAHEVFGDTANELGMTERQRYQDMHEAAVLRTAAQGKPEQAEQTGEPGPAPDQAESAAPDDEDDDTISTGPAAPPPPQTETDGDRYLARIRTALADPVRTFESIAGLWNATKDERAKLLSDGQVTKAQTKELQEAIKARAAQAQAAAPAGPGPTAPPAEESDLAKMDREFRAQVAACSTMEEIGNLVANTMVARNAFSGTAEHKAWTALVAQRRKQISGVA